MKWNWKHLQNFFSVYFKTLLCLTTNFIHLKQSFLQHFQIFGEQKYHILWEKPVISRLNHFVPIEVFIRFQGNRDNVKAQESC